MKYKYFNSLQARYTFFALVLGILLLTTAFFGYFNVSSSQQQTTQNLSNRTQLLESSRLIRINILDAYKSLDLFLLNPERTEYKAWVNEALDNAIKSASALQQHQWIKEQQLRLPITQLESSIKSLKQEIEKLFSIRIEPTLQYPAMKVGNTVMQPSRNNIINSFALVMNELNEENAVTEDIEVYQTFLQAKNLWDQMLSNFRLYIANRVGSFNEKALPQQEQSIDILYQGLKKQLSVLSLFKQDNRLGIQSDSAIDEINTHLEKWYNGFVEVKTIHQSGEWRMDSKLMKEIIAPLFSNISLLLQSLEVKIELQAEQDLNSVSALAHNQNLILWLTIGLGLCYLLIIVVTMNRMVFRPIKVVSRALKAEAFGNKNEVTLPLVNSRETQVLIDAFSEMKNQVHNRQIDLEYQALHDSLTTLPNRILLQDRMEYHINQSKRHNKTLALLMLDLDRFKDINDTLGHHIGDQILADVGIRLSGNLRNVDTVARLGGDEFAVLLPDTSDLEAEKIALKIIKELQNTFHIGELQLFVGVSIGIATYPEHGKDVKSLMQHADVAMYTAKHNQQGHAFYDPDEDKHSIGRLSLTNDLRHALEHQQLQLHYQPKQDISNGNTIGMEALLRWQHPDYGAISPEHIINLAEQTGLITPLTYWVLEEAIKYCSGLMEQNIKLYIAVNLSVHILKDEQLVNKIRDILQHYKLPSNNLTLEITENAMMTNPAHAINILTTLNSMGIQLSIDDFGTGFSSLSYLKKLPVHELKIDKSFVMHMMQDNNDEMIVHSTINLAHNLNLHVVAEGVEDAVALQRLKQMGCDTAQGYYISHPLPESDMEVWLEENYIFANPLNLQ